MDAIIARHVTKTYRAGVGRARVREMLPWPVDQAGKALFPKWWGRDSFNALEDVSLSVPIGASVGIIGHNGAGKTTLLRLIYGVSAPTSGKIVAQGRVGALLDVLIGFHPDLTGRENVYLLGSIHGFGRRAMNRRMEEILEFAEIHELADTPLKRYSAGMSGRLGFGTLAALDVDILLLDEVLAVGDAAFQQKCVRWLDDYRSRGGTLLFVSHNLALVRNVTERAAWLDSGRVVREGPSREVVAAYARDMDRRDTEPAAPGMGQMWKALKSRGSNRWGAGGARVEEVSVGELTTGNSLHVVIHYEVGQLGAAVFCVGFVDDTDRELGATASHTIDLDGRSGVVQCIIDPLPFRSGIYFPVIAILSSDGVVRDRWKLDRAVVIDDNGHPALSETFGPVDIHASWSVG